MLSNEFKNAEEIQTWQYSTILRKSYSKMMFLLLFTTIRRSIRRSTAVVGSEFLALFLPQVNLTGVMGTFDVAAEVDGVKIKGEGGSNLTLSSSLLANLNRQLQFITYTNTLFHPNTADSGETEPPRTAFPQCGRHGWACTPSSTSA